MPCSKLNDRMTLKTRRLSRFRADLHVHTALSPCASDEMTPPAIVRTAMAKGLDIIAVCDHNSAGNVEAVQVAARQQAVQVAAHQQALQAAARQQAAQSDGATLAVLCGMEVTSAEEVHVLGLFPDLEAAHKVSDRIRGCLPPADQEYYSFFGRQSLLSADGEEIGLESASLAAAVPLPVDAVVSLIHGAGGLAIAAHVDRRSFSVYSQLGFFPRSAGFDAIEVSRRLRAESELWKELRQLGLPVIRSSDSHFLDELGTAATELYLCEPTFAELALAFAGLEERRVVHA